MEDRLLANNNFSHPAIDPATNRFASTEGYLYDKNGNITKDAQNRQFVFNAENKQREVKDSVGGVVGRYYYDGEGRRVKKVTPTETTIFVYSAGKLVEEYSTDLPDNPTTNYLTRDPLNSPRVITDAEGEVISRRDFMPFGEESQDVYGLRPTSLKYGVADEIRQKFTGYEKDTETQLNFAEARYYNEKHARFTTVDPMLASGRSSNPQTFNRYVYGGNNPIMRSDPNGTDWYQKSYRLNGKLYIRPVWREGIAKGVAWHSSGTLYGGQKVTANSYAYQDSETGKWHALDFFENRSKSGFDSKAEAENQISKWNKQSLKNHIGGFLNGISLVYWVFDGDKIIGAENGSDAYGLGDRVGIAAGIATVLRGGATKAAIRQLATRISILSKGKHSVNSVVDYLTTASKVPCCFIAGTPIRTDKGLVPIEKLKVGDKVLSYNEKTKKLEYKKVAHTFIAVKENIIKIKIRGEKLLTTTTEHPFYIKKTKKARDSLTDDDEDGEWLTAIELKVGQKVLRPDGLWTRITSIKRETKPTLVYNLEVENNHNYFVGEIGVLSHNCDFLRRALKTDDFGKHGSKIKELDGTFEVKNGIATIKIEWIAGGEKGIGTALFSLVKTAKETGASSLVIKSDIMNQKLLEKLQRRYGDAFQVTRLNDGYPHVITINF